MGVPKVSIIVPVYNVQEFLPDCIESILSQSLTDFELLLIDDGSQDNSGDICDDFAKKDIRVQVFHKQNGGVSSARNLGLEQAKGEWIAFVDSDDYCGKEYLSPLLANDLDGIDIIQVGFFQGLKDGKYYIQRSDTSRIISNVEYFSRKYCRAFCWIHLIRTRIIKNNHLLFNVDLAYSEDKEFIYKLVLYSTNILILPTAEYYYRFNKSSAVNTKRNYFLCRSDLIVLINLFDHLSILKKEIFSVRIYLFKILCRSYLYSLASCLSINKRLIKSDLDYIMRHDLFVYLPLHRRFQFVFCSLFPSVMIIFLRLRIFISRVVKKILFV
ncbi:glycosyltransferase [Parabacteroides segnis]|uniref:glycosyltransferase family 2 protein n=1 Tax=Parabacteroides segnis TaxID=2763058 RepID=UPI0035193EB0